jgi:hypothetical protein
LQPRGIHARHRAQRLRERVRRVEPQAVQHEPFAHAAQRGAGETLLGGCDDGQARGVRRARRILEPDARVDRHPARGGGVEHVPRGLHRALELARETAHDVGDRHPCAELSLDAA